jgi:protein translocase SecG subunit
MHLSPCYKNFSNTLALKKYFDIVFDMQAILPIIQIILSILLIVAILLQHTGTGIEGALGGGESSLGVSQTRRGFEKFLFRFTITVAILFTLSAVASIIV